MGKMIDFKGIVRATSAQNNADGNCEEVVNMRQDNGIWRTVGKKKVVLDNDDYADVFVHEFDGLELYWGKLPDGNGGYAYRRFDIATGQLLPGKAGIETTEEGYLTGAQNFLVSMGKRREVFLYHFGEDKYDRVDRLPIPQFTYKKLPKDNSESAVFWFNLTDIRPSFTEEGRPFGNANGEPQMESTEDLKKEWTKMSFRDNQMKDMMGTLIGAYREVAGRGEGYANGYVFLCASYELFDGSEVNYTPPMLVELGEPFRRNLFHCSRQDYQDENDVGKDNNNAAYIEVNFKVNGVRVENLSIIPSVDFSAYKNVIKRMNVYMTPVIDKYDVEKSDARYLYFVCDGWKYNLLHTNEDKDALPKLEVTDKVIGGLQFYRVLQFNPGEMAMKAVPFRDVTTNNAMPVDGKGWFEKSGKMYLYNQRIHMYDYVNLYQQPDVDFGRLWGRNGSEVSEFYTYIKTGVEDVVVRQQCNGVFDGNGSLSSGFVFTFPDARAYKMVLRGYRGGRYCEATVNMVPSDTHNFAFSRDRVSLAGGSGSPLPAIGEKLSYANKDSLIVYEANNPLCHGAGNSYRMDGYIRHVGVSTEQISGSQVGQFPLYVFTDRGIYALQTGSGAVLYSSVIPVSAEVATGRELMQTKYGIIFPTINGLKMITGQEVTDLSEPVDGVPDREIRRCPSYGIITNHDKLCRVERFLSAVPFREYAEGAAMGYDISRDELIVSNVAYDYSYVLGLKTRTWHKITEVFTRFCRHLALRKVPQVLAAKPARAGLSISGNVGMAAGETVGVMMNGTRFYYTVKAGDNTAAVAKGLAGVITGVNATAGGNLIVLEAEPGLKGNDISLQAISSWRVTVRVDQRFVGGKDESVFIAVNVCDLREEKEAALPVLLQTRPLCMDSYGFKSVYHTLLRGELKPVEDRYFGVYALGSDDLVNWQALSQYQFNSYRPHVILERNRQSFRYLVLIACGEVQPSHRIAMAEFDGAEKFDNRLR